MVIVAFSRYFKVFSILTMAQSKPSYEDDDYKWINHKDETYSNIFNLRAQNDGLMIHEKLEEEAICFTGSNYPEKVMVLICTLIEYTLLH